MRAFLLSALAITTLAACEPGKPLTFEQTPLPATRAYAAWVQDQPFDTGPVSIVAEEHGELHTFTLAPCRGGATVCQGTAHGRAALLQWTPDYAVVTGTYHGRTFYLSPGGDGWMKRHGQLIPLAWDDASALPGVAVTAVTDQGVGLIDPR